MRSSVSIRALSAASVSAKAASNENADDDEEEEEEDGGDVDDEEEDIAVLFVICSESVDRNAEFLHHS